MAARMKRRTKRVTVRLAEPAAEKLERIARRIVPRGSQPNLAMAVRNLIEKEKL